MFFNNMKDWHLQHKQLITPSVSNRWKKWQVGTVQLMQPRSTITVPTLCWDHTMFGEHAPVHCHVCHCRKCKTIPYHQDMYTLLWFLVSTWNWISVNPRRYITSHHQTSSKSSSFASFTDRIFMDTSPPPVTKVQGFDPAGKLMAPPAWYTAQRDQFQALLIRSLGCRFCWVKNCLHFFDSYNDEFLLHIIQLYVFGIFINYMWLKCMVNVGKSSIRS